MTTAQKILWLIDEKEDGKKGRFAKKVGIDPSYVSKLVKEPDYVPSERIIDDICDVYGCSKDWLLNDIGDPFPPASRAEEIGNIAAAARKNDPDEARRFFIDLIGDYSDAKIMLMYELYKERFGK